MYKILVGMGSCGISAGARPVYKVLKECVQEYPEKATIEITGCLGLCYTEPLLEIRQKNLRIFYGNISPEKAKEIFQSHILQGIPLEEKIVLKIEKENSITGKEAEYLKNQFRIVLRNCGCINPEKIEDYEERSGYQALKKVLSMQKTEVLEEIKKSGLRGRGGAGFLTGQKWAFAAFYQGEHKYVICNADEGDPGAFMDRSILESDPHSVLEGMLICGYTIGADFGYIYCRAEYPLAIVRLKTAIEQARDKGYLGKNILGSFFSFDIKIKEGAGAFVCGEETALMASLEGQRGMPRIRPPFPAEKGLWQSPTNINNVETLANVPWILQKGAKDFSSIGTQNSKGTKVFALAGKIQKGGLAEVPMGISIEDIVYKIGGGIKEGRKFKAIQMGGPSGGCIPESLQKTPIDYENITKTGAIMGSGGLVVMDDTICMVEVARFFLEFTQKESCGKCTFCRIGTLRMLEILERITIGEGKFEDIEKLKTLAIQIKQASLCGLGQTAPNPVLTTLKYYEEEYLTHIKEKKCPAHYCSSLVDYIIDEKKCTGCTLCAKNCPVDAISGEPRKIHTIHSEKCVKCGKCITVCNFDAVYKG